MNSVKTLFKPFQAKCTFKPNKVSLASIKKLEHKKLYNIIDKVGTITNETLHEELKELECIRSIRKHYNK